MKWFESFGIAMIRGMNIVVFLSVVAAGVLFALGTPDNPALAGGAILASILAAGLVTGMMSLFIQIYEQQLEQTQLLKQITQKMKD